MSESPISIPATSATAAAAAHERQRWLTKPQGALGALEAMSVWCASVQGQCPTHAFQHPALVIIAGDHGIVHTTSVSAYPPEVTGQMVLNFLAGGAAANVLARQHHVDVHVVDISVNATDAYRSAVPEHVVQHHVVDGSGSIDREDAVSYEEAVRAFDIGLSLSRNLAQDGIDLVIPGDMGIGNTTMAAAIVGHFTGSPAEEVTGHGTGIDQDHLTLKTAVVRAALERMRGTTPLQALAVGGGADIAAMCGLLVGAAQSRIPVLLDGVVSTAAALAAEAMAPGLRDWCAAGHVSTEPASRIGLRALNKTPILDIGMRLGEGSGALVALPVLQSAALTLGQMATFAEANVSDKPGGTL